MIVVGILAPCMMITTVFALIIICVKKVKTAETTDTVIVVSMDQLHQRMNVSSICKI